MVEKDISGETVVKVLREMPIISVQDLLDLIELVFGKKNLRDITITVETEHKYREQNRE